MKPAWRVRGRGLTYASLLCVLFITFCLPEAYDQRYSIGVLWVKGVAVSVSDIVAFTVLLLALVAVAVSGKMIWPRVGGPLLVLAAVVTAQAVRVLGVHETREVVKDFRPLLGWIAIVGIVQLLRNKETLESWVRDGTCLLLLPPVIVVLLGSGLASLGGLESTFGGASVGRISFVNDWPITLLMLTAGFWWFRRSRSSILLAFAASALVVTVSWLYSQSRVTAVVIAGAAVMLLWSAMRRRRFALVVVSLVIPSVLLVGVAAMFIPLGSLPALERVRNYLGQDSSFQQHDTPRFDMMAAVATDFVEHPLVGTGLGKVYYRPRSAAGLQVGERLTSPADSLIVELAAKLGVVGLGAFAALFVTMYRQLRRIRARLDPASDWRGLDGAFVDASIAMLPLVAFMSVFGNAWWHYRTPPLQMAVWFSIIEALTRRQAIQEPDDGGKAVAVDDQSREMPGSK